MAVRLVVCCLCSSGASSQARQPRPKDYLDKPYMYLTDEWAARQDAFEKCRATGGMDCQLPFLAKTLPEVQSQYRPRGLYMTAAGKEGADVVNTTVSEFVGRGQADMDVMLFAFDDFDWEGSFPWATDANVRIERAKGPTKYYIAASVFLSSNGTAASLPWLRRYDFIFFWDDDVVPLEGFDFVTYMELLATYGICVSQPTVVSNGHRLVTRFSDPENQGDIARASKDGMPALISGIVEVMAPVYQVESFLCVLGLTERCRRELSRRGYPPGLSWGIDLHGHSCLCNAGPAFIATGFLVQHRDLKSATQDRKGHKLALQRARVERGYYSNLCKSAGYPNHVAQPAIDLSRSPATEAYFIGDAAGPFVELPLCASYTSLLVEH